MSVPKLRFPEFLDAGEWEEKTLSKVGQIITGNTPSTANLDNYGGNKLFVSPADMSDERYVVTTKTTLSDQGFQQTRQIKANSILFVCIGSTIGKVAQNKFECATNQQINSIVPFTEYSNDFIYSALENSSSKIALLAGNHAVPIINKTLFSSVLIGCPSLPEQTKIADCLSSIDDRITAETQKLDTLKAHKKGLMQQLFPTEGETLPKLRFPEFQDSGEWEEKKLGDLGEFKNGINFSADKKGNGTLTVDVLNMYGSSIETKLDSLYRVDVDAKDSLLQDGDILFVRSSMKREGIGWASLFRDFSEPVLFCGFLIRLRLKSLESSDPRFLLYYLRSDFGRNKIICISGTAAITNISQDSLKTIPVPIPPLAEQQKIADCLTSIDEAIAAQSQAIELLKLHKKGLMQQLFPFVEEVKR